jgi:hypothetical protein
LDVSVPTTSASFSKISAPAGPKFRKLADVSRVNVPESAWFDISVSETAASVRMLVITEYVNGT